jgi:hypothetical protein
VRSGNWLGRPSEQCCTFCAISRNAEERQDFEELGAFELNSVFFSWKMMGTCLNLLLTRAKLKTLVQMSISLLQKSYGRSYGEFSEPGFPYNFAPPPKKKETAMT